MTLMFNDSRYTLRPSWLLSGIISLSSVSQSDETFLGRSLLTLQQVSNPPVPLCSGSWSCCVRGQWGAVGGGTSGSPRLMEAGLQRRAEEFTETKKSKQIRVSRLDRHGLERRPQKSLDVDKGWETEGVTLVPQTIHGMWLVWWPGGSSPRPLQPPSDQWWGGAATAPNSLSLTDERPVVLEWHGLGCGQSRHTLNTFVTTHRMSFSTFTWEYSSQRYIWLSPSTISHNNVKFDNTKLVWKNYFLVFLCYK